MRKTGIPVRPKLIETLYQNQSDNLQCLMRAAFRKVSPEKDSELHNLPLRSERETLPASKRTSSMLVLR